jgi:DNA-binding MarR family transcriptional regulator
MADIMCACANLRRASRALSRVYDDALAAVDLTTTQMTLLLSISRFGPVPLSKLALFLEMDRTSLYRTLRPMQRRGLVGVRSSSKSERIKEAHLTQRGERHLARAMPVWRRAQDSFVTAFGRADWERLRASLSRVVSITT